MTDTSTAPDTTSLEDWDYTPPCEMATTKGLFFFNRVLFWRPKHHCPHPAEWLLICLYCGGGMYNCEQHRRSPRPFACGKCRRVFPGDKAKWVKL